ncbi:MAG: YicC/YloC family endoribonuclease [Planctomycetota bacterium]
MIYSMTGYGAAQCVEQGRSYSLEIRSVNHRYLKHSIKVPEFLAFAEGQIEKMLRSKVARGSIDYTIRVRGDQDSDLCEINVQTLQKYVERIAQVKVPPHLQGTIELASLASLPGVCVSHEVDESAKEHEQIVIGKLTDQALESLNQMRRREGETLSGELIHLCEEIRRRMGIVGERAPFVVDEYHERLKMRVATLMKTSGVDLEADGLMREVAVYAERCDISEELSRLSSHLDQFANLCGRGEQVGRTLDFLTQELLREANTVASKSNDVIIARAIVEVKGLIDRLREQVQNVE